MKSLLFVPLLAACTAPAAVPLTGAVHRFAIDRLELPTTVNEARIDADDLNGDGEPDNELGQVSDTLSGMEILGSAVDMIAAGTIASSIEIQADDLGDDPTVGVRYFGSDGDDPPQLEASLVSGWLRSNRTGSTEADGVTVVLPFLIDAGPAVIAIEGMEIDLQPDGSGYDGLVRGVIQLTDAKQVAALQLVQMIAANPQEHPYLAQDDVAPKNGTVSLAEAERDTFLDAVIVADIEPSWISIGYAIHLVPCDTGACAMSAVIDHCSDRVADAGEADVDCGGSCALACPGGATCTLGSDCQSQQCGGGTCAPPSCADGVRDGFEQGIDCGWNCAPCP